VFYVWGMPQDDTALHVMVVVMMLMMMIILMMTMMMMIGHYVSYENVVV
jgi:hypothetical protein